MTYVLVASAGDVGSVKLFLHDLDRRCLLFPQSGFKCSEIATCHEAGRCRDELDGRARSGAVPEGMYSGCPAVRAESGVMPIVSKGPRY